MPTVPIVTRYSQSLPCNSEIMLAIGIATDPVNTLRNESTCISIHEISKPDTLIKNALNQVYSLNCANIFLGSTLKMEVAINKNTMPIE